MQGAAVGNDVDAAMDRLRRRGLILAGLTIAWNVIEAVVAIAFARSSAERVSYERRWIRHLHASPQWQAMFPHLPGQSAYHKRLKRARPLLCEAIVALAAACPSWF